MRCALSQGSNPPNIGLGEGLTLKRGLDDLWASGAKPTDVINATTEWTPAPATPKFYERTNKGSAERLRDAFVGRFAYCAEMGWYGWDEKRGAWTEDAEHLVWGAAINELYEVVLAELQQMQDAGLDDKKLGAHRSYLTHVQSTHHLEATLKMLGTMLYRSWREYDQQTNMLTVPNGTLVFTNGDVTLKAHDPNDLITRASPVRYNPDARHTFWTDSLQMFIPDDQVRAFLQRFAGSVLVGGGIREQKLPIMHGGGANGKSTFVGGLKHALGRELAIEVDPSTLRPDKRSGAAPSPDKIRLRGARFVYAVEASGNMDAELLKRLTGGEEIVARQLHKKTISFKPTFTLAVVANEAPSFDDQSEGLWRRIVVIPFNVRIADSKRIDAVTVGQLLEEEAEGILAWCVEGYRMYARDGFSAPDNITLASALMRDNQDYVRVFLREHVIEEQGCVLKSPDLHAEYSRWQQEEPEAPRLGSTKFAAQVDKSFGERAYSRIAGKQVKGWVGRRLRNANDDESVVELSKSGITTPYYPTGFISLKEQGEVVEISTTMTTPDTESNSAALTVTCRKVGCESNRVITESGEPAYYCENHLVKSPKAASFGEAV